MNGVDAFALILGLFLLFMITCALLGWYSRRQVK